MKKVLTETITWSKEYRKTNVKGEEVDFEVLAEVEKKMRKTRPEAWENMLLYAPISIHPPTKEELICVMRVSMSLKEEDTTAETRKRQLASTTNVQGLKSPKLYQA